MLQKAFPGDTLAWARPFSFSHSCIAGFTKHPSWTRSTPSRSAETLLVFWSAAALPLLQEVETALRQKQRKKKRNSFSSSSNPTSAPFLSSSSSVDFPPYDVLVDEAGNMILRVHLPFFDRK
jgi:hypothetical protein